MPGSKFAALLISMLISLPARADFSFVHFTDTHVTASDKPGSNAAKDAEMYREISALTPQPKFAFSTGDVVEVGTPQEYEFHRAALKHLAIPYHEAPGNHDVRWNPLGKEGFEKGVQGPLYQSWDRERVHFIFLDSTVLLQHWGHFDRKMLDWLRADLQKVGTERPIVIGFHHWIGRDAVQADNESELLEITAPYNVKLWLQGHGHSDIQWNINGAPAIMAKGLYQGSYNLVEISGNRLRVLRRTLEKPTPTTEVLSISLEKTATPNWKAAASRRGETVRIEAKNGDLPVESALSFRFGAGKYAPLEARGNGWFADVNAPKTPGEHRLEVRAVTPDGRNYTRFVPFSVRLQSAPAPIWVAAIGGAVQSKLVAKDGALYVSTMGGDMVCLDARTGFQKWKFATGGSVFSSPLVENGAVVFGSADHFVYSLDAKTGKLRWKTETGGAVFGGAAFSRGVICIASVDTQIYGLDAESGAILWKSKGEGMFQSQAASDGERFFVGGWDNMFRALEVATGREIWAQKFGKSFYYSPAIGSPTTGAGRVYVSSNDGILHAMDAATGKIEWEVPGPALGYSGPLLRENRVFNASLTGEGKVFGFNSQNGEKAWETPTGSVIYDSSCAFGQSPQGGAVYVGSVDGTFSAIRAVDGKMLWQYQLAPGHLLASPATDGEKVYIGSQNGFVTALPLG